VTSTAEDRHAAVVGSDVREITLALLYQRQLSVDIVGLSIRAPRTEDEDILMTIRGVDESGGPVVTFLSGRDVGGLFCALAAALRSGRIKWKPDEYRRK